MDENVFICVRIYIYYVYIYIYIYIVQNICALFTSMGLSTKKNEVGHLLQLQWWKLKKLRLMRTHFFTCTPFGGRNHRFMVRKFSKKKTYINHTLGCV